MSVVPFPDSNGRESDRLQSIEPGELAPQLKAAAQWVGDSHPEQIEVRTPIKRDWRTYAVEPDWRQPSKLDPD
jgi:hypothetical protein